MTLAIDIIDGCGLSNRAHHEISPQEEQVNAVLAISDHFSRHAKQ